MNVQIFEQNYFPQVKGKVICSVWPISNLITIYIFYVIFSGRKICCVDKNIANILNIKFSHNQKVAKTIIRSKRERTFKMWKPFLITVNTTVCWLQRWRGWKCIFYCRFWVRIWNRSKWWISSLSVLKIRWLTCLTLFR